MKTVITRLHLWLGLVIGLQMLLWMASGVVMSWFPIDTVRGTDWRAPQQIKPLDESLELFHINDVIGSFPQASVTRTELFHLLGRPVYLVSQKGGVRALVDAQTGAPLSPISAGMARAIAGLDYDGTGPLETLALIEERPGDYKGPLPVWRAQFADPRQTALYISPDDGRVLARRNGWWRTYDLFWMLHIMDYQHGSDFNSLLLRLFATAGLLFAASGLGLVFLRLTGGRYGNDLAFLARQTKTRRSQRMAGQAVLKQ